MQSANTSNPASLSTHPVFRVKATPLARRRARESGLVLDGLSGRGPRGRVLVADVEALLEHTKSVVASSVIAANVERVPFDTMRASIAGRLTAAKRDIPHIYLSTECRMDTLLAVREELNASALLDSDGKLVYRLSINDLLVRAWAVALQRTPAANVSWAGDAILQHSTSDVGIAVSVPGGLYSPVVRDVAGISVIALSRKIRDLVEKARARRLAPQDLSGGSSAISNLGMFGVSDFAAIINPPHGSMLAVGAVAERPWADAGKVFSAKTVRVTLSCDHRVMDGAAGAEALASFRSLVETPILMFA